MQVKLEKLENKAGIEWQNYFIGDLFNIGTGTLVDIKSADIGPIPRISVQTTNNGILGLFGEGLENARYFQNFISVNFFGVSYYHHYKASVEMKVHTLKILGHEFTKAEGVFITAILNKNFSGIYSYGNQLSSSKLKNDGISIQLPTITKNGTRQIAFDFMEQFISTLKAERIAMLKAERIATLNAYLKATGLSDYALTADERAALDKLNSITWGKFKIENVLNWQQSISELNPLDLDSLAISKEEKYPFYGQATTNKGIIEYRHLHNDVLNNKLAKPTILIHSNNQNTVYVDTPFYLKDGHGATSVLQSENLDKHTAHFLIGAIKKVVLQKYSYNAKATKIELKNTEINLPIKLDLTPDYDFMRLAISAMHKVVIKDFVFIADERIAATEKLVLC